MIARRLGVDAVVTGSVRRSGDRLHVTARLVQTRPQKVLWSKTYDRDVRDVFGLESDVARAIVRAANVRSTPEEKEQLVAASLAAGPEVYEPYLRGRQLMRAKFDPHSHRLAVEDFEHALDADPGYGPAWSGMAEANYNLSSVLLAATVAMPRAREAAERALAIDTTLSDAHVVLGLVRSQYEWNWDEGERSFRRALKANPNSSYAHWALALLLGEVGRIGAALDEIRLARELDPLSPHLAVAEGGLLFKAGRTNDSRRVLREVLQRDPVDVTALAALAETYEVDGMLDSASVLAERALGLAGHPYVLGRLGRTHARAGRPVETRRIIRRLEGESSERPGVAVALALNHFELDESAKAFEYLERAAAQRDEILCWELRMNPTWAGIRSDPRGRELMRRMGLLDENSLRPMWYAN